MYAAARKNGKKLPSRAGGGWTLEAAARAIFRQGTICGDDEAARARDAARASLLTRLLPRVNFLERPYPAWWDEPEFCGHLRPGSRYCEPKELRAALRKEKQRTLTAAE